MIESSSTPAATPGVVARRAVTRDAWKVVPRVVPLADVTAPTELESPVTVYAMLIVIVPVDGSERASSRLRFFLVGVRVRVADWEEMGDRVADAPA